jgi:hypothetical protein
MARRLANDLKLRIYGLVRVPAAHDFADQRRVAATAPRTIARGFGRYLRLARRASKAAAGLIARLRTATPPDPPRRHAKRA